MTLILGIDPGSRVTGYGLVAMEKNKSVHVASGCVDMADLPLAERLREIFVGLTAVIREHRPDEVAIEKIFMNRNADSAIKLGPPPLPQLPSRGSSCPPRLLFPLLTLSFIGAAPFPRSASLSNPFHRPRRVSSRPRPQAPLPARRPSRHLLGALQPFPCRSHPPRGLR